MSLDLALMIFDHIGGAERAYADVLGAPAARPGSTRSRSSSITGTTGSWSAARSPAATSMWTSAGDVIGKRTAEGALTGAVAGVLFGPAGFAVGLVAGGTAGGVSEAEHAPHLHDALVDEVRAEVPEKSSAVLLLASPEHVDAMVAAFEGHGGRLVRHHLSPEGAQALEDAVVGQASGLVAPVAATRTRRWPSGPALPSRPPAAHEHFVHLPTRLWKLLLGRRPRHVAGRGGRHRGHRRQHPRADGDHRRQLHGPRDDGGVRALAPARRAT